MGCALSSSFKSLSSPAYLSGSPLSKLVLRLVTFLTFSRGWAAGMESASSAAFS